MVQVRKPHKNMESWITFLSKERKTEEIELIEKSCLLAKKVGNKQKTPWGESCCIQGQQMGEILAELGMDAVTVAGGILYPSLLYANLSLEQIKEVEPLVSRLLAGFEKMELFNQVDLQNTPFKQNNVENLRKMLLAVVEDVRIVLIKLADHLCKMRFATKAQKSWKEKLSLETKEVFAPLANRLGVRQLKWELEDLMFRFLQGKTYRKIAKLLDEKRIDREKYIESTKIKIEKALLDQDIQANVAGRAKHIYSIWRKMHKKMIPYHEIYDVRAFRILVPEEKDCYAALGIVHALWHHIPKEFDDYIANPKENGYQSLHTAVVGDEGKTVEIQIRTVEMHEQAELGVASHWRYKEGLVHDPDYDKKLQYLRQLLDWQESLEEDIGGTQALEEDFFEDRIYVLTPLGSVIGLPSGATPIDFAYHIHTQVGHGCRGAKVNNRMVPLSYILQSGDKVEILTAKEGGPSRDWLNLHLNYIRSMRSRSKIHQWFKQQDRSQNIELGKEIISRELKRLNFENISFEQIAKDFKQYATKEDFLAALGSGDIKVAQILGTVQRIIKPLKEKSFLPEITQKTIEKIKTLKGNNIIVEGVGNLLCQLAQCCKPVLGDEIIGYITLGKGVSIHRKDCMNILRTDQTHKQRLIEVNWGSKAKAYYTADLKIIAFDRKGLLSDITGLFACEKINLSACEIHTDKKENLAKCLLRLEVPGVETLGRILARIQQIPNVLEVKRISD